MAKKDMYVSREEAHARRYRFCPKQIAQTPIDFTNVLNNIDPEHIQGQLVHLWEAWDVVLGETLSRACVPLGHKKSVLIVGCEDSMALQDVRMQQNEILERVNAFLAREPAFFSKVCAELRLGQKNLAEPIYTESYIPPKPPFPTLTGAYLPYMNPETSVTRCYDFHVKVSHRR